MPVSIRVEQMARPQKRLRRLCHIVRDATDYQELHRLVGHRGLVKMIVIDPAGRLAISGGLDGIVRIWDLPNKRLLYQLYGHTSAITSIALSMDGQHILSASEDGSVRLWDTAPASLLASISASSATVAVQSVA